MVAQQTLTLYVEVRILLPLPKKDELVRPFFCRVKAIKSNSNHGTNRGTNCGINRGLIRITFIALFE